VSKKQSFPVEFGGVSFGDHVARVGIKIAREHIDLDVADGLFCGHRLTGTLLLGSRDDQAGQSKLFEDQDIEVNGVFDVKRLGVNAKQINASLAFSSDDIDVATLAKSFPKGSGKLNVVKVEAIPDDDDMDDVKVVKDPPGALRAGLNTVGDMANWTAAGNQLDDIKGLGPAKVQQVEDRMLQYWADNPQEAA